MMTPPPATLHTMPLDDTDRQLISLLREDACIRAMMSIAVEGNRGAKILAVLHNIRLIDGIANTETSILLSTYKA